MIRMPIEISCDRCDETLSATLKSDKFGITELLSDDLLTDDALLLNMPLQLQSFVLEIEKSIKEEEAEGCCVKCNKYWTECKCKDWYINDGITLCPTHKPSKKKLARIKSKKQ